MLDERTEALLQQSLEEPSEEVLEELTRHLRRSGYGSDPYPNSFEEVRESLSTAHEWLRGAGERLISRVNLLLGPLEDDVNPYLVWREISPTGLHFKLILEEMNPPFGVRLTRLTYSYSNKDRDPGAIPDEKLIGFIHEAVRRFGISLEPWLTWSLGDLPVGGGSSGEGEGDE